MCGIIYRMDELRETLVAQLRKRGVTYLAPSDSVATEPVASTDGLLIALLETTRHPSAG
jgi:hypothetical protein